MTGERLAFTLRSSGARGGNEPTSANGAVAPPPGRGRTTASDHSGFAGLLCFTAVMLVRPQDQIPALAPLHLAEVAALAGLVPMVWGRLSRGLTPFPVTTETLLLVGLGLVMIGTAPFSVWPGGALAQFTDSYIKALVVYLLMISALDSPERLRRFTWLILVCIGYVAFRGALNYARGVNLVEGERLAGPVSGIFGNPNDLALNMVTFLPFALVAAMSRVQTAGRRLVAAGIAALMVAAIVFSKSRGGAVGLVVMLAALFAIGRRINPRAGVAAIVALVLLLPLAPASFWDRMSSITDARQDEQQFTGSRGARQALIQDGLRTFFERPLTGVGAGQFKNYNPPGRLERWRETHNVLLQVAAETGVFGLLFFLGLMACAAVSASKTKRLLAPPVRPLRSRSSRTPPAFAMTSREHDVMYHQAVAAMAGLIGWMCCAMFASVAYSWTFYYLLGLIVSAREIVRDRLAVGPLHEAAGSLATDGRGFVRVPAEGGAPA